MNACPPAAATVLVPTPLDELLRVAGGHAAARRLAEAEAVLRRVLAVAPDHAEALHQLGLVAHQAGRPAEALALLQQAIAVGIDTPLYYRNIAELYRITGQLEAAEAAGAQAVALNPADPVAHLNLGIAQADRRRTDAAIASFERALALDPSLAGAHFGLAEALLRRGDLARGWAEYEWRFRLAGGGESLPPVSGPLWDGGRLDATLLLVADQGFGDAIQFGRYIAWAAPRCRAVAVACSATLQPLLAQMQPGVRLFSDWHAAGDYAAWCPLTGLPRLAGTTLDSVPRYPRPLRAEPARAAQWRARLDQLAPPGARRIGIAWAGRAAHRNDHRRSITLAALAPLAAVPGICLVVLQKGPAQRQAGDYRGRAPLINLSAEIEDFADTMAVIEALDLVVSVDTSVAHLAGAMGRPVWIMLPWAAEWRWLEHRTDTPWYPSARLFRQPQPADWNEVTRSVAAALRAWPDKGLLNP